MTTENLSLLETKHLVEKSRGKLTMLVLRDNRKFLVSIPEVEDSPANSTDERRWDSSSELEGELRGTRYGTFPTVFGSIAVCRTVLNCIITIKFTTIIKLLYSFYAIYCIF